MKIRETAGIRTDMLEWIKTNLYTRVGQEWDYAGKDFDPLVHLMVGACASEFKQIYDLLADSDRRVLRSLTEMLVPESRHLPSPAVALAEATPTGSLYPLSENLQLQCEYGGEKVFFSPVFEKNILHAQPKIIATDNGIFSYKDFKPENPADFGQPQLISSVLIGFECAKLPESFENISFYFDVQGENKYLMLEALAKGRWNINKTEISIAKSWNEPLQPEEILDTSSALKRKVENTFGRNFVTITDEAKPRAIETSALDFYSEWVKTKHLPEHFQHQAASVLGAIKGPLLWIDIQLAFPVWMANFAENLTCSTKIFPVANRRLWIKDDVETFFDQSTLNVIQIHAEQPIAGFRRIFNPQNGESFTYHPITQFKQEEKPTYTLRHGGIGRVDQYNAWQRFSYLLDTLREEHKLSEVVERIGSKLSVEDLHQILGERISKNQYKEVAKKGTDLYVMVHPGVNSKGVRSVVEYWTTLGELANGIGKGQSLMAEPSAPGLKKEDKSEICAYLVTPAFGGKNIASESELFHELKDRLYRRGRLYSLDDVKSFCKSELGDGLVQIDIKESVELDRRPGFGLTRIYVIELVVKRPDEPRWPNVMKELEMMLADKAVSIIPFRIRLKQP